MKLHRLAPVALLASLISAVAGCSFHEGPTLPKLEQELTDIAAQAPGCVGIAFVGGGDTITVNNTVRFPMMSVFKLHQSLATLAKLEKSEISPDSLLRINADELDYDTWSPMTQVYGKEDFDISIRELIERSLIESDNNASNLLFRHIASPEETDRFVRSVAQDTSFAIGHSEAEMKTRHDLIYGNYSSPLAATLLIMQIFNGKILAPENQMFVECALLRVATGADRLPEALKEVDGIRLAHKTGSGYRSGEGLLTAFNDVAYIILPDGRDYGLAVMMRDFDGSDEEAAAIMAEISRKVYKYMIETERK